MFISFEGPEGAGKSTLISRLKSELEANNYPVLTTREPGAGELGRSIRKLLLEDGEMPALSELFLFLADRANHVETIIRPALAEGKIVLCDRHADSTIVYQGYARGLDLNFLREANLQATQNLRPDLIILLDLDPEVGLGRQTNKDRLDKESLEFHQKVRNGFLSESLREPARWQKINAAQSPEEVFQDVWAALKSRLIP
ncbi:dTMP kinase [bacterium]|nr:dTMP kinase [bacterium]